MKNLSRGPRHQSLGLLVCAAFSWLCAHPAKADESQHNSDNSTALHSAAFHDLNVFVEDYLDDALDITFQRDCTDTFQFSTIDFDSWRYQLELAAQWSRWFGLDELMDGELFQRGLQYVQQFAQIASGNMEAYSQLDMETTQYQIIQASEQIADFVSNGQLNYEDGTLFLHRASLENVVPEESDPQRSNLAIFNVHSQTLESADRIEIDAPQNAVVMINVSGDSVFLDDVAITGGATPSTHILWNFHNAVDIELGRTRFPGTVLAPDADIFMDEGLIDGGVFARTLDGILWIRNCLFSGWELLPLPHLLGEAMFPESSRGKSLAFAGTTDPYSYETCSSGSDEAMIVATRVKISDLDKLPGFMTNNMIDGLEPEKHFFRVITSNLGKTVTISGDEMWSPSPGEIWTEAKVNCEDASLLETDPQASPHGKCSIGVSASSDSTTKETDGYLGTIVIADLIAIDTRIDLSKQSLILAAKNEIRFMPGSSIRGASIKKKPEKPEPARAEYAYDPRNSRWGTMRKGWAGQECDVIMYWGVPSSCETKSVYDIAKTYTDVGAPVQGQPGDNSGSLVLISPSITGSGTINLDGQKGQDGEDAPFFYCEQDNPYCRESLQNGVLRNGGNGGKGGNGGSLLLITDHVLPNTVTVSLKPGSVGKGGTLSKLATTAAKHQIAQQWDGTPDYPINEWFWLLNGEPFVVAGSVGDITPVQGSADGQNGMPGTHGSRLSWSLKGQFSELAHLVARRGANRLAIDGDYYARYTDPATTDGQSNRQTAISRFEKLQSQYCADLVNDAGPVNNYFVDERTQRARHAICNVAKMRLGPLQAGLNYFGFSDDMLVYITPDKMKTLHGTMIGLFDDYAKAFDDSAVLYDEAALDDHLAKADHLKVERQAAQEIATASRDHYAQRVLIALDRMNRNQNTIDEHMTSIDELGRKVRSALVVQTSLLESFSAFLELAGSIASIASGSVGAIGSIGGFIASFEEDTSFDAMVGTIKSTKKLSDIGDTLRAVQKYADRLTKGLKKENGERDPGFNNIVGSIKELKSGVEGVITEESFEKAVEIEFLAEKGIEMELELRDAMEQITSVRYSVEDSDASFTDKYGALAMMDTQIHLVKEAIALNKESQDLYEEHLLAAAELSIAGLKSDMAELSLDNAEEELRSVRCRSGEQSGAACIGIPALFGVSEAEKYRDSTCLLAKNYDDQLLLFDFLYRRSKDFASLTFNDSDDISPPTDGISPPTDFRLTLLDPVNRGEIDRSAAEEVWGEMVDQYSEGNGYVYTTVCDSEADCGSFYESWYEDEYADAMMATLRSLGKTKFSLDDACNDNDNNGIPECTPFVNTERVRQRVTGIRARVRMRDGYRLGCTTVDGCPPDSMGPADTPFGTNLQYYVALSHEPLATFRWDDNTYRTFEFANRHASDLCELAMRYSKNDGSRFSCEDVLHFRTVDDYRTPSTYPLDNHDQIAQNIDNDPHVFGTSVRGEWQIDFRQTLVELSSADGCYGNLNSQGASSSCLPETCSTTHVTMVKYTEEEITCNSGADCLSGNCGAEGFCLCSTQEECNDEISHFGVCHVDSGICHDVYVVQDEDGEPVEEELEVQQPSYCELDDNNTPRIFNQCAKYVDYTRVQPILKHHGDSACCSITGHMRGDLSAEDRAKCIVDGWFADTCKTPDDCYRICGSRCQAFKDALDGFEVSISWWAETDWL